VHTLSYGRELLQFYEHLEAPQKDSILTDQVKTLLPHDMGLLAALELLPENVTLQTISTLSHHMGLLEDYYNIERSKLLVIDIEEIKPRKKASHRRKRKKNNITASSNS